MTLVSQEKVVKMMKIASVLNCENLLSNCSELWVKKMCQNRKITDIK